MLSRFPAFAAPYAPRSHPPLAAAVRGVCCASSPLRRSMLLIGLLIGCVGALFRHRAMSNFNLGASDANDYWSGTCGGCSPPGPAPAPGPQERCPGNYQKTCLSGSPPLESAFTATKDECCAACGCGTSPIFMTHRY